MIRTRRNRPGTRAKDLWNWPFAEYQDLTGPFAVQEYIQKLIRMDPSNISRICEGSQDIDRLVWQYEHTRQFIIELNLLVVKLLPVCLPITCPKMKATDDCLYLCASHEVPQECSAIDYMIHTLDNATAILNNSHMFNSRVNIPHTNVKHLLSIARRLYRLFTHTYFHHRDIFNEFEKETRLCARFTEFAMRYELMTTRLFIIPTHAFNV